ARARPAPRWLARQPRYTRPAREPVREDRSIDCIEPDGRLRRAVNRVGCPLRPLYGESGPMDGHADLWGPAYHPATLLKINLYGYLNRVQSSRRLEREAQRNIELMWLTGRLAPDFKTIADFGKDNGAAIRAVCARFVVLCRELGLFTRAVVAIDGSKFNG